VRSVPVHRRSALFLGIDRRPLTLATLRNNARAAMAVLLVLPLFACPNVDAGEITGPGPGSQMRVTLDNISLDCVRVGTSVGRRCNGHVDLKFNPALSATTHIMVQIDASNLTGEADASVGTTTLRVLIAGHRAACPWATNPSQLAVWTPTERFPLIAFNWSNNSCADYNFSASQ
jgi:hypothetical protein